VKILDHGSDAFTEVLEEILQRREQLLDEHTHEVDDMIARYRKDRESFLVERAKEFQNIDLGIDELFIEKDQIKKAHKFVSAEVRNAFEKAKERIEHFQMEHKPTTFQAEAEKGVFWGTEMRPLDRIGIYVPGGARSTYFTTLLLAAVPARIMGVKEIIVATPPVKKEGAPWIEPDLLYCAKLFDIEQIVLAGGTSGFAALAFGTSRTKAVQKLFGSCGRRAVVAKQRLSGYVGVDGMTGPSEIAILCDDTSSTRQVAADMIARSDLDPDAELYVFHPNRSWLEGLNEELANRLDEVKDAQARKTIQECLESNTFCFQVKRYSEAIELVNQIAPGIVCLPVDKAADHLSKISCCGTVLLGNYTPPTALDLIGGPTGLVKTLGSAAYSEILTPGAFVRRFGSVEFDKDALERLHAESSVLAKEEGFSTHELPFKVRLED
jgi:histidinol dehydrogenase